MTWPHSIWHQKIHLASLAMLILLLPFSIPLSNACLLVLFINAFAYKAFFATRVNRFPVLWALAGLFIWLAIGMIYSADQPAGWLILEKKMSFLILPVVLMVMPTLTQTELKRLFQLFIVACITGTLICVFIAGYKWFMSAGEGVINFNRPTLEFYRSLNPLASDDWMYFSYIELASGIGAHPTYFGMYLAFCLVLLYFFYAPGFTRSSPAKKFLLTVLIVYLLVFILFLSSRIVTWVILILGLLAVIDVLKKRGGITYQHMAACLSLPVLLFGIVYINPVSRYRHLQEFTINIRTDKMYSLSHRLAQWQLGWESIATSSGWIGTGTGDADYVLQAGATKLKMPVTYGYDPHNQFMIEILRSGWIGALLLVICLVWPACRFIRSKNYIGISFIALVGFTSFTESILEQQKGIVFFALFFSLLVSQSYKPTE
jgi:O-antigen ligase